MESDSRRVLGVLAGADIDGQALAAWARSADVVLAADGAADRLLNLGVTPHVTVGDMDSVAGRARLPRLVEDADQATSDADKLLSFARSSGYENLTLTGLEGDRLDHMLASLASAARSPLFIRFVLRTGMGWMLTRGRACEISTEPDDLVSLIPLEACERVDLCGVRWPLAEASLASTRLISLSNRATGSSVRACVGSGLAVLFRVTGHPPDPAW